MHRLVQQVVRRDLGNDVSYLTTALKIVYALVPREYANHQHFTQFASIAEHTATVFPLAENAFAEDKGQLVIVDDGYYYLIRDYEMRDEYKAALYFYIQAAVVCEKAYGVAHPAMAAKYNNIGEMYRSLGKYDKAIEMFKKSIAIKEMFLQLVGISETDDILAHSVATSYTNICSAYLNMKQYKNALRMFESALSINEVILGSDHPRTGSIYRNIGHVYSHMGDYEKAMLSG